MRKKINAILIHHNDNVITVIESLHVGSVARYQKDQGTEETIARDEIPKFHKMALVDIKKSQPVYKYGQLIGEAIKAISKGSHVHDHNISSPKKIS